jgi:hypothetical protein
VVMLLQEIGLILLFLPILIVTFMLAFFPRR